MKTKPLAELIRENWKERTPLRVGILETDKDYQIRSFPADPSTFQLPLNFELPKGFIQLLSKGTFEVRPNWIRESTYRKPSLSTDRHFLYGRDLFDPKVERSGKLEKLFQNYESRLLTEHGRNTLTANFARQLPSAEIGDIHHNLRVLIGKPEVLDSIDLVLGLWNYSTCDHLFDWWLRSEPKLGNLVNAVSSLTQTLDAIALNAGLRIPEQYRRPIAYTDLEDRLQLHKAIEALEKVNYQRGGEFGTQVPGVMAQALARTNTNLKDFTGYEELAEKIKISVTIRGGKTYEYTLPLTPQEIRYFLRNVEPRHKEGKNTGYGYEQTQGIDVKDASTTIGVIRNLLMRISHYNFDERARNEPITETYEAIKSRVGFFDYIASLASKSIMRAKKGPSLDFCFPSQHTSGEDIPIGIVAEGMVQPFNPGLQEIPNDTYYGTAVNIVTGPNSGGKTYFWNQTLITARIAAGIGDIVNAATFRYDPKGRIVIPYIPDEVDKSRGGFDATAKAFSEGLSSRPLYRGDIIIQDEAGGTTSESVEAHMVKGVLIALADQGIGTFYITHNKQLIDSFDGTHPAVGIINCPLERKGQELKPTHKFTPGTPNWENYFNYAVNLADKRVNPEEIIKIECR